MSAAKTGYSLGEIDTIVDAYLQNYWEDVVRDLNTLVSIPSYREDDKALPQEGAPFGPGPRKALSAVLGISQRMGFSTCDLDGYLGYADWPADNANEQGRELGEKNRQIGIIGHVDVVPAGPGWSFEPYAVTRKDGFLMGRGVADDKGPVVVALHAMNLWKQQGVKLPYDVRFLFGTAEETGMEDVDYYQQRFDDPDFLFTPDAEFPVCYGEKGHYDGTLISQLIPNGNIIDIQGGSAPNAVPGSAFAIVRCANEEAIEKLPAAERITLTRQPDGNLRIDALGECQHASLPEGGINAIGVLVDYLLQNNICTSAERDFLQFDQLLLQATDGSGFGCACADEDFGALTLVGGMISFEAGRIHQTIDCRFPTCISADEIERRIQQTAKTQCASAVTLQRDSLMEPFLINKDAPEVQTLLRAYNEATGEHAQPFTMGGGTYARKFKNAASFGPEKPWVKTPDWVGGMHSPDEGVSEESLKEALRIYAHVLIEL